MPKIAIIGSGYVGVVTAACLAEAGNQVVAYDIDKNKIAQLTQGKLPFYEEQLSELILAQKDRNLSFTSDIKIALSGAQACFIAVSTPHDEVKNSPVVSSGSPVSHIAELILSPTVFIITSPPTTLVRSPTSASDAYI